MHGIADHLMLEGLAHDYQRGRIYSEALNEYKAAHAMYEAAAAHLRSNAA
jgi:hypothetical protein